ncbi:pyridoxal phosphate-dependent decarboxylase family protein [Taibaiella helva]|uniref:pyridoxal phosphate-dependent decarboxylase family protein n=1 Tax=Taibaiella helva TaxID=2301235 RepID=UPI0018E52BB4|nr:aspartate aminotransferase family protein [Taibaiella helva]
MEQLSYPVPVQMAAALLDAAAEAYPGIFNAQSADTYSKAIQKAKAVVLQFLEQQQRPFSGISVAQLNELFDTVDFDTPLQDYDALLQEVQELYVNHATAFHLPQYIAHLNCPVVIPALVAEVLISAINSSQDTWDQSAGGTLMEQRLIAWTATQIGFGAYADGVFTSGGTLSNLMGMLLARDHFAQEHFAHNIKKDGNPSEAGRFKVFVSEKSHFSNLKNASLLGLGEQGIVKVSTDQRFRMDVAALQSAIEAELAQGNIPIAVIATAGTTDFGNIDPLEPIARLAGRYNIWMHVDAAYGCGLLLSNKYRDLLQGIELADSVTIDYHKSFFQPVSSSAFIVRHRNLLKIIRHHADYLNPEDQDYEEHPSLVNKTVTQVTRRFDALKLWCTLRMLGKEELGRYIDTIIDTAAETAALIEADPELELLCDSDISALLFRYVPGGITDEESDTLNSYIKKEMFRSGEVMVASTKVNGRFYLKFTLLNPVTTIEDIRSILQTIKQYGDTFYALS